MKPFFYTLIILSSFFLIGCKSNAVNSSNNPYDILYVEDSSIQDCEAANSDTTRSNYLTTNANVIQSDCAATAPVPGLKTLRNLIITSTLPIGETMYIWGGGWNGEDTHAGIDAKTIGVSPRWKEFADTCDSSYNHKNYLYMIHDGLDCSGYMGWILYNVFEDTTDVDNEKEGYVVKSGDYTAHFAQKGYGTYTPFDEVTSYNPGDIINTKTHVMLCLGTCSDGSVLIAHSRAPGVRICGSLTEDGKPTKAVELAEKYMSTKHPDWYAKYPNCSEEYKLIHSASKLSFNQETFSDADEIHCLSGEEIIDILLGIDN